MSTMVLPKQELTRNVHVDTNLVATVILGGGEGRRLYPLTLNCCKPYLSFGGNYRLIDVPVSNSISSGIRKIFVLTQYLSSVLHKHIMETYRFDAFSSGTVEILAAEQKPGQQEWYQGTADAVRQNIDYLSMLPVEYFLILSGDHLYNMNFMSMLRFAKQTDADLVVGSILIDEEEASRMGVMKVDDERRIVDFIEKPNDPELMRNYYHDEDAIKQMGITNAVGRNYLASMGIYVFKREALIDLLRRDARDDFGKHLIPTKIEEGNVFSYVYNGYWEDIGTVSSYYKANLALTDTHPHFRLYDAERPVFSKSSDLPPAKVYDAHIIHSILCAGSVIDAREIKRSIIGKRVVIKPGTVIQESIVMGNDYYWVGGDDERNVPLQIGTNCVIKKAIIGQNVTIGNDVKIINKNNVKHFDGPNLCVRDGIVVVLANSTLEDGFEF